MNALLGELHMVNMLHQQSGVYLFTHQWKWKPQAHAEGVDALFMSFTQFAREIDGGSASEALTAFLLIILRRFEESFKQDLLQLQPQLQASATPKPKEREAV
uniref:Uncharacterized protein n=1 Tax=Hyaloperonospora arabidopsidis (strain Emoy2) TaxID=559515 RepID=M4BXI7_HYAAE